MAAMTTAKRQRRYRERAVKGPTRHLVDQGAEVASKPDRQGGIQEWIVFFWPFSKAKIAG